MPDDRARADRLGAEPRTDLSAGDRMRRFADALHLRLVRDVQRLDPATAVTPAPARRGEGGASVGVSGGRVFTSGRIRVFDGVAASGEAPDASRRVGLALRLDAARPEVPGFRFVLRYVAEGPDPLRPTRWRFDGRAGLVGSAVREEDARRLVAAWDAAHRRSGHSPVLQEGGPERGGAGVALTLGPLSEGLEGDFLLVRDLGRTLPAAYLAVVAGRGGVT